MSDSFPLDHEGPDPYEGQDLDGLLSGENCHVPETLRPVIPTLDALRAAPMRSELRGEAEARAYFRTIMRGGESEPARPEAGAVEERTLILSTVRPRGEPRVAGRHRHRRPPRRGRWQTKALAGVAAAAVVIAGAAALASTSGSGGHPASAGRSHGAPGAATSATAQGSNAVDGHAAPVPTKSAASSAPGTSQQSGNGPSPRDLCREFSGFFTHPGQHVSQATEYEIFQQLKTLAGGPRAVGYYCARLLQLWAVPQDPGKFPAMLRDPFADGLQGAQGSQGAGLSPGTGGSRNGGNGGNANGSGASSQ